MKSSPINISDLADYVISYHTQKKKEITQLKLQKLLYYLKVWGLVSGEMYTDAQFLKWEYGPVNREIWMLYKDYGKKPIPSIHHQSSIPSKLTKFLDFVLDCYSPINTFSLSALTHSEEPWKVTKKDDVISEQNIFNYYSNIAFAKNFPIDVNNKPFYPVQTDFDYSFIADMNNQTKKQVESYPSFNYYLESIKSNIQSFDKYLAKLNIN